MAGRGYVSRLSILSAFALIMALVVILAATGGSRAESGAVSLTPEEREWLNAHPVIKLAPDPDFKPIEYFDENGVYRGAAADHIHALEKKLGITITIVRLKSWDEVMDAFKRHDVDLLGAVAATPDRERYMLFTDPLVVVPGGIFSAREFNKPLAIKDLQGLKVAVVSNYMAHDYLRNAYPQISLDVVPDVSTGLAKASLGMVDVYVENMANATFYLQEAGITNLRLVGKTDFTYRWGIGVRKDWPVLQRILNKGLAALSEDEKKALIGRWIHVKAPPWRPSWAFVAGVVASLAGVLLVAAVSINLTLKRKVHARTAELQRELAERRRLEEELTRLNEQLEERVRARTAELEREVADRQRAEEALQQLTAGLEQRVRSRTAELEASNRELESFTFAISHDLRAPVRHISGYAEILTEELAVKDCRCEGDYLARIMVSCRRMQEMIDSLLALSRISRKELQCEEVDLSVIARQIMAELREAEPHRRVEATIADGIAATGDPVLLRCVIENLLHNAWKYTGRKDVAHIEFGVDSGGGEAVYYVRDDGAGFDAAYAGKLFTPFQRLHTDAEFTGTGVGLATVQRIIHRHGGRVWAFSESGRGACFFFTLNAEPA
jgi:signal transduction histidine kinase